MKQTQLPPVVFATDNRTQKRSKNEPIQWHDEEIQYQPYAVDHNTMKFKWQCYQISQVCDIFQILTYFSNNNCLILVFRKSDG